MKGKWVALLAGMAGALGLAAAAGGVWKVNQKVNNLSATVEQVREVTAAGNRLGYIPDLVPGKAGWKVTQFGDVQQQQEMCYTVTTDTGLVIIDGGWEYEVPRLRKIISQYGNSVEAWILTHPHPDHMTAFLEIFQDPQGAVIHHVYTTELPDMETLQENASWEDYTLLEKFRSLSISGLEYLHKGDHRDILGLDMEVLSAYSEKINEISNDLMNDGSLMFRLKGKRDSILFCADVGSAGEKRADVRRALTDYFVEEYGESLRSDYVQMAHHGFSGLDAEFYEMVDPRAAFFDAPHWLMSGEGKLSSAEKAQLIQDMGKVIFSYYTAPNQILLE